MAAWFALRPAPRGDREALRHALRTAGAMRRAYLRSGNAALVDAARWWEERAAALQWELRTYRAERKAWQREGERLRGLLRPTPPPLLPKPRDRRAEKARARERKALADMAHVRWLWRQAVGWVTGGRSGGAPEPGWSAPRKSRRRVYVERVMLNDVTRQW